MRQIRYFLRLPLVFLARFRLILFAGALIGGLLFLLLPRAGHILLSLQAGRTIGMVGRFSSDELPLSIQQQISFGLTAVSNEGTAKPSLAESWEYQDEGRVWIFRLGDHKWQDGSVIKANDINYKFSDVTPEVLDEKTIKFTLKDPFSPFPGVVSKPVFKRGLLGAGEWKVAKITFIGREFVETIRLVNTKNNNMQTYKFYPAEESARTAFKLGEVDELHEIVDSRELANWQGIGVREEVRKDRFLGVFINNEDPILSSKELRQALSYAIDKEKFGRERALSPISPFSWAYNSQVKPYEYNPERAKELLAQLPAEQRKDLVIKLVTTPTLLSITDKIKEDWDAIGVNTQIQVSNTLPSDFQTLVAIQIIPPDPDQYSFWHSTQTATNITRYRNSRESQRIDKLLEDGRRTLSQDERKLIYLDFQRFLVEDSPVIFLFHPVTYMVTRK